jgi:TPR repeat protein
MTLKIHLLLLVVWVCLTPHPLAEEQAATKEGPSKALRSKAEKGDVASQFILGFTYEEGRGVAKDGAEAVKWYRMAAEQGHIPSQVNLASMLSYEGSGKAKNEAEAAKWYRKAAEQGETSSQAQLGFIYSNGHGVPKDEVEAVKWWRKAAEKGNADSQYGLGVAYANGHGVAKDGAEAVKWYRMAAEQGDASAQHNLALKYALGEGVPKDDALAYKWILLAGAKEEKSRETIPLIEKRLTPEQRAEGQKLAREFKPVVQKKAP